MSRTDGTLEASYKAAKVAFVSNNTGDTVLRINTICWTAIATYHLWKSVLPALPNARRQGWQLFLFEFGVLVMPMLLVTTVLAAHPVRLCLLLHTLAILASHSYTYTNRVGRNGRASTKNGRNTSAASTATSDDRHCEDPETTTEYIRHTAAGLLPASLFHKPFVTVWRAHMMLMTVLCILAVDFPAFPRSFGKCETTGTSLMDLGVGSFVFALGLVSSLPFLRRLHLSLPPTSPLAALKRTAVVLALGLARIIMVKGTDYPEHVTEYGVHWNFFFTLGLLPVCGTLAERLWRRASFRTQALIVTAVHQTLLLFTPLQKFTFAPTRSNVVTQNIEGLVSFSGYLAIYLIGMDTGMYTLPPDPYFANRRLSKKTVVPKPDKLISVLFSYAIVWWTCFGILHTLVPHGFAVSRVLANSAYVFWTAAFNVSFLLLYLLFDRWLGEKAVGVDAEAPMLFRALNKNGLAVFLIANLLTGIINLSIPTMFASDGLAITLLTVYLLAVMSLAWSMRNRRLKI